jgi:hypothetical protein
MVILGIVLLIIGIVLLLAPIPYPNTDAVGWLLVLVGVVLLLIGLLLGYGVDFRDGHNGFVLGGPILLLQRLIQRRRRAYADPLSVLPGRIIRSPRP